MFRTLIAGALAALIALPATAQESRVKGWDGLQGRETAVFRAKVVDVLCELSGDCAEKCGEGRRQMGLVREDDGRLILAAKNQQAGFQGAAADLYPFCGQTVAVDGLMVAQTAMRRPQAGADLRSVREHACIDGSAEPIDCLVGIDGSICVVRGHAQHPSRVTMRRS